MLLKSIYSRASVSECFFARKKKVNVDEVINRVRRAGGDVAVQQLARGAQSATLKKHEVSLGSSVSDRRDIGDDVDSED